MVLRRMTNLPDALLRHTLERCDRTASAAARRSLQSIVWRYRIPLSSDCIFRRGSDALAAQEESKEKLSASLWMCTLCGKQFMSEYFLNMHLVNRHSIVHSSGTVCLADLCGIIAPCPPSSDPPIPYNYDHIHNHLHNNNDTTESPCTSEPERNQRHAACMQTVRTCYQAGNSEILAYLESRLCDAADAVECGKSIPYPVPYPHRYGGLRLNTLFITILFFVCTILCLRTHRGRRAKRRDRMNAERDQGKLPSIWDKEKKVR